MGVIFGEQEAASHQSCLDWGFPECQSSWVVLILTSLVPMVELATQHMLNVGCPSVLFTTDLLVCFLEM